MVACPRRLWAPESKSQSLASGSPAGRAAAQGREKGFSVFGATSRASLARLSLRPRRRWEANWPWPSGGRGVGGTTRVAAGAGAWGQESRGLSRLISLGRGPESLPAGPAQDPPRARPSPPRPWSSSPRFPAGPSPPSKILPLSRAQPTTRLLSLSLPFCLSLSPPLLPTPIHCFSRLLGTSSSGLPYPSL